MPPIESKQPTIGELSEKIIPKYAARWRSIGIGLQISTETLEIIKYNNPNNAIGCCMDMFIKWLEIDNTATWERLKEILASQAVTGAVLQKESPHTGNLHNYVYFNRQLNFYYPC